MKFLKFLLVLFLMFLVVVTGGVIFSDKIVYNMTKTKNSEFKNFRKDMIYENYENLYKEIVKFCIVNGIEYELV